MRTYYRNLLNRFSALLLCACLYPAPTMAAGTTLEIGANLDNLGPGDVINVSVGAVTGGTALSGDVYLTLTFPSGALYYIYVNSNGQPLVSPSVHPLAVGITLPPEATPATSPSSAIRPPARNPWAHTSGIWSSPRPEP